MPVFLNREALVRLLEDITAKVKQGDSFDGSLRYTIRYEDGTYEVAAAYRHGNLDGQGFLRLIGENDAPSPPVHQHKVQRRR